MTRWPDAEPLGQSRTAKAEYWKQAAVALAEVEKQRRLDKLAAAKLASDDWAEIRKSESLADLEIQKEAIKARLEVAKGGVERARDNAKFIQVASAGLGTAYTGVLTLAFSAAATQLPTRGFIPTVFFGVAVALATGYLAFIIKPDDTEDLRPTDIPRLNSQRKADSFVLWVRSDILAKAPLLRGAVIALLFGVFALPVAMVKPAVAETPTAIVAAEPSWPPFPSATPVELAAVLYAAQLQDFREAQAKAAATPKATVVDEDIELRAWSFAAVGLGIVFLVTWPFWVRLAPRRIASAPRPRRPGSFLGR